MKLNENLYQYTIVGHNLCDTEFSEASLCSLADTDFNIKRCRLPSSTPSQPCLVNKHCRLHSLELQSLHPESPIDPPDVLYRTGGKKLRAGKAGKSKQDGQNI